MSTIEQQAPALGHVHIEVDGDERTYLSLYM